MTRSLAASPVGTTKTIQFLTQEELRRLFIAIDDRRDAAIFLLSYRHGLRASEVGLLQFQDLDFSQ
jgi:integrase